MARYPVANRQPAWLPYATKALRLAMAGEMEAVGPVLVEMCTEHGGEALSEALLAWVDTLLTATGVDEYGGTVQPAWSRSGSGVLTGAEEVPPATAWAGRLVAARAADDPDLYAALVDSVPPERTALHVCALLDVVATTLTNPPVARYCPTCHLIAVQPHQHQCSKEA